MQEYMLSSGIRLKYREKGQGPSVLMLHGWTSGSWLFESLIDHLADRYHCIAPDLKGHGQSDKPLDSPYTMAAMLDETREFIAALGLDSMVIIGHSMGGMLAQKLFVENGHRLDIRGLVLLGTSPGTPEPTRQLKRIIKGMRKNILKYNTHAPPALMRKVAVSGYDPEFAKNHPEKIEFVLEQAEKVPPTQRVDLFEDMSNNYCVLQELPGIDVPCLCLCGSKDSLLPATRIIAQMIPTARMIEYEGAGHIINWEREQQVNQAVADFLEEFRPV